MHRSRTGVLAAAGLTAALVLLPGTAGAEEPTTPALPADVTDVLDGIGGDQTDATTTSSSSPATTTSAPSPGFEVPPEIVAAFQELAAQAGISEDCVTGIAEGIELIGTGLAGLPGELQGLITDLGEAVQGAIDEQDPAVLEDFLTDLLTPPGEGEGSEPPLPVGGDIAAGLELIATTLAEDCAPAPAAPTSSAPPTSSGAGYTPPAHTPSATHPAPQAAPQTVTYLGYAPTGAEREGSALAPVAALGSLALVAGAGALGYRRWRAPRRDG